MTRKHIETLVKKLPFDRESFLWAQSAVVTRNFQGRLNLTRQKVIIIGLGPKTKFKSPPWLIKNDKNSSAMLVPFLDIANHSSTPNCIYSLGR